MSKELAVDPVLLREEVKSKYRDMAINPSGEYHFHTGRPLASPSVTRHRGLIRPLLYLTDTHKAFRYLLS